MKPKKLPRGKAVRIFWADSATTQGWQTKESGEMAKIATLGFVTKTTPEFIVVSTSIAINGDSLSPVSIPWRCVLHIQKLPSDYDRNNNLPTLC